MKAPHRPRRVPLWLALLGYLGAGGGAEAGPPTTTAVPSPAPVSDARLLTPDEVEELLPDALFTAQADTALMVNGDPALTDRGLLHVTAADFGPTATDVDDELSGEFWLISGYVEGGNYHCTQAVAPVFLPNGVTVNSLALVAYDNVGGSPLELHFSRRNAYADVSETMSYVETAGTEVDGIRLWFDGTIDHRVINNGIYQYDLLTYCLNPLKKLRSVFVYYTY